MRGRRKDWSKLVVEYRKSGATQKAFCEARSIPLGTLQYHLQKERSSTTPEVVPHNFVELQSSSALIGIEIEIRLPSGAALRLRG